MHTRTLAVSHLSSAEPLSFISRITVMTDATPSLDLQKIRISGLTKNIDISKFNCGVHELDSWIGRKCWKAHDKNKVKAFYAHLEEGATALGLYTLSLSIETTDKLDAAERNNYQSHFPAVYLGQLAVLRGYQNQKLGTILLLNALERAYQISRHVAYYGVALRSLNDRTTVLYERYGFRKRENVATPLMILPVWSLQDLFNKQSSMRQ
jgi:GNAT superfamily N-acetyltransferase